MSRNQFIGVSLIVLIILCIVLLRSVFAPAPSITTHGDSRTPANNGTSVVSSPNSQVVNEPVIIDPNPTDTGLRSRVMLSNGTVMCTQDGQSCPNGTSVKRVPPACEFAPCL